ncbi:type VII secretion target [Streptomyces sp. NPDC037389]|uniref:type VII secretion target n=1 Tax=Streptomyces sp. NPDC037389 TaxID=3155369 RepID=UPI0033CFEB3C
MSGRLQVETGRLEEFSRQVGRAAEDASEMASYTKGFTSLDFMEHGLLGLCAGQHTEVRDNVLRTLDRLSAVLRESARELGAAASYYRRTDLGVAAETDAAYGRAGR